MNPFFAILVLATAWQSHLSWARDLTLADLKVTQGAESLRQLASGLLEISGPRLRATERAFISNTVELSFGYHGRAEGSVPLEGGADRIQIGQKMFAANPCNLLYVMWRLYPDEAIVVSIKRGPGTTSSECGNDGYTDIVPDLAPAGATTASVALPVDLSARGGQRRALRTSFDPRYRRLSVRVDGRLVWRGHLPSQLVVGLMGPAGVRSDNGVFRFELSTWNYRGR